MRLIVPLTVTLACGAAGAFLLPAGAREAAWWALGALYLGLVVWGFTSLRSRIFCTAWNRGSRELGEVALTYDDGPDPRATPALLDLLHSREVTAAFFCVGNRVRENREIAVRCHEQGHLIANHSDRHSPWTNFFPGPALRRELTSCQDAVRSATGAAPLFYRPPYGLVSHAVEPVCRELGLEVVGWDVRSFDTTLSSTERIVERVLRQARPGGIILLHDGGQSPDRVVEITAGILDGLHERGLSPVRLDRLRR